MKCAKVGYVLENGLVLKGGDTITIICNNGETGTGKIIDISEDGVMISIEEENCEMDCMFDDIKDITKLS